MVTPTVVMAITTTKIPHIVIIGAGFGGLNAARALRKAPVHVTVIDRSNHHLFQPLLYQVATAGLSATEIASPIRSVLRRNSNTEVLMGEVVGVDPRARQVKLADRWVSYDYLLIATGARHSYFQHPEWEQYAPGLKSVTDATIIRRKILLAFEKAEMESNPHARRALLNFVIVGAGPTGVELAGSIAELAHVVLAKDFRHIDPKLARVILLEAGPRILASFPEDLARRAERELMRLGVEVRKNGRVEEVDQDGVSVSGERLAAKTVIWAAGVTASPAAMWLGAEMDRAGRVKVLGDLTVPGQPDVYVIGDTAEAVSQDGKPLPGVAPVAIQQGRYVAQALKLRIRGDAKVPPFRYIDKGNLATIGRRSAIAQMGKLHIGGFPAWMVWVVVHIYYLISFRNRLIVLIQWAWAYWAFQRGARLIPPDPQKTSR